MYIRANIIKYLFIVDEALIIAGIFNIMVIRTAFDNFETTVRMKLTQQGISTDHQGK